MTDSVSDIFNCYGVDPMPTKETWQEYLEFNTHGLCHSRYIESTIHMLQKIESITKLESFDEMKNELSDLFQERLDFVAHAVRHEP